jgi:hypothetical protein
MSGRLRVLTANDLAASFFPQATSYGARPGAAALQATVDDCTARPAARCGSTPAISPTARPPPTERWDASTIGSRSARPCATA